MSIAPGLAERVGYGRPASTPPLAEMGATWDDRERVIAMPFWEKRV